MRPIVPPASARLRSDSFTTIGVIVPRMVLGSRKATTVVMTMRSISGSGAVARRSAAAGASTTVATAVRAA